MSRFLLYDLTAAQTKHHSRAKYTGGYIYAITLLSNAIKLGFKNFECAYNPKLIIENKLVELCKKNNIKLNCVESKYDIKNLIKKNNFKKFYSALPYNYTDFNFKSTEFIFTIHGLRPLEMPHDETEIQYIQNPYHKIVFMFKKMFSIDSKYKIFRSNIKKLINIKIKKIIVVSEHTKYSLMSQFSISSDDILVNYSPIDFKLVDIPKENKDKYFLLISANRWIKNSFRAIKAIDDMFSNGLISDKKVIVIGVGKLDFSKHVVNKKKFLFLDYVGYTELENYFNNAFCFIYPSLNEGFGYPPIQAMKYGTPVIASSISSIPEVCQDAALYFNPYSLCELQNRILHLSTDKNLYDFLRNKGYTRVDTLRANQECKISEIISYIFN